MNVWLCSHDSEAPATGRSKASKVARHSGVDLPSLDFEARAPLLDDCGISYPHTHFRAWSIHSTRSGVDRRIALEGRQLSSIGDRRDGLELVEIADSAADAAALALPPLLIREPLERFLDAHGIGQGAIEARQIGEGHSNVTYCLRRGDAQVVLRRPPRPPLPPSAHDVLREARIIGGLADSDVPVPRILATCSDLSLLGVPFYLMEYLDGVVLTDATPPGLASGEHRAAIAELMVGALAALHAIDTSQGPLAGLGKPSGYLERQLRLFGKLWEAGRTRELPVLDRVTRWLADNLPASGPPGIVHGDYRLGNMLLTRSAPVRLLGIVDWEMATLGDPLADLGYLTAHLAQRHRPGNVMTELQPVTREPGFPDGEWMASRYAQLTGRSIEDLCWYRVLAIWKSAIFLEQSYKRFLSGNENDPWFAEMGEGVPELADQARREAGLSA
jgi:aminoglycoside phosphotransferase (APT) family kinase protein